MVKYHLITFATDNYISDAKELCESAKTVGNFDTVTICNFDDLDNIFKLKNSNILNAPRGAGFWLWKPYIIQKKLLEIDNDDILCYCDSSYLFKKNIKPLSHEWLTNKNIAAVRDKPNEPSRLEQNYTKMDTLILMNIPKQMHNLFLNSYQVWAGFILFRKSLNAVRFVGEWLTYAQDQRIITDSKSIFCPEKIQFIDNRHDQSILSILLKKWRLPMHEIDKYFLFNKRHPIY